MSQDNREIMVSVQCLVYNHEKFLRQCLDGFVMQKTNFKYEVIVHDDASTDGSIGIIKEYAQRYPDIIIPFFEKENQYKKGGFELVFDIVAKLSKGKYVAICEGDDYWLDPNKLQKQYDIMEHHPELDMCAHSSYFEKASTGERCGEIHLCDSIKIIPASQVIIEEGDFLSTNSLFYRSTINQNLPSFRKFMNYDYTIQIHGSLRGGILYIPEHMSVYHVGVSGSFCNQDKTQKVKNEYIERKMQMLSILDQDTNAEFHNSIQARLMLYEVLTKNSQIVNIKAFLKYKSGFRRLSLKQQFDVALKCFFPQGIRVYHKILNSK